MLDRKMGGIMASAKPKHNYDLYNEQLTSGESLGELRLKAMAKQLNSDKITQRSNHFLYNTLGLVYQRLGQHDDAAAAFKASFMICKTNEVARNVVLCLIELKEYSQAMDFSVLNGSYLPPEFLVWAAALSGRYHDVDRNELDANNLCIINAIEHLGMTKEFSDIYRYIIDITPIEVAHAIELDMDDDGEAVVCISVCINATVEEAVEASWKLSSYLVDRFSPEVLMHILPIIQVKE